MGFFQGGLLPMWFMQESMRQPQASYPWATIPMTFSGAAISLLPASWLSRVRTLRGGLAFPPLLLWCSTLPNQVTPPFRNARLKTHFLRSAPIRATRTQVINLKIPGPVNFFLSQNSPRQSSAIPDKSSTTKLHPLSKPVAREQNIASSDDTTARHKRMDIALEYRCAIASASDQRAGRCHRSGPPPYVLRVKAIAHLELLDSHR